MKKKYLLLGLFLVAAFATITTTKVNSKITSPPVGTSGDPFTNATCSQSGCHPSPANNATSSELTLTIGTGTPTTVLDNNFTYIENTTYNIGFLINAFTGRYGFQMTCLDGSNAKAGTFAVSNAATTKINTAGGTGTRQYMGHLNASATKNWVFKWTAPAATTGDVTFYYSFNTADNNNSPTGDVIYKGAVTISPNTTGVENISDKLSALNISPNPVSDEFRISFEMKETNSVSSQLYSLDGKVCKQLMNEKLSEGNFSRAFDINDMPSGIYLVKINVGESSVTKKIINL